jgi:hypothetical protein
VHNRKAEPLRPLSITVLPQDLSLVGEVLAAVGRAHRALTGHRLTTAHIRIEELPPWGRVLVVYDEQVRVEEARRCPVHDWCALPCGACRADALAGDGPGVRQGGGERDRTADRPTPLILARARRGR